MASQGPSFAGTASSVGGETAFWSNPSNAEANDSSYATATLFGNDQSQRLTLTNFGFTIPGGSTITGVEVNVERSAISGAVRDVTLFLLKSSAEVGSGLGNVGDWPGVDGVVTYGGSTTLWGTTFTSSEVNNSGFGVDIQCEEHSGSLSTAQIDYVTITVYYTAAGTGIAKRSMAVIAG